MTKRTGIWVEHHLDGLENMTSESERRRVRGKVTHRAAFVMEKFVPMREGFLRKSQELASRYEEGDVIYNTPYAARQYNLHTPNRTTPGTDGEWDKPAFEQHGKDLAAYAAEAFTEGQH